MIYILKEVFDYSEGSITNESNILAASNDLEEIIRLLPKVFSECKRIIDKVYTGHYVNYQIELLIFDNKNNPKERNYRNLYQTGRDNWIDREYSYGFIHDNLFELKNKKELSMLFSLNGYNLDSFEFEEEK